MGILNMVNCFGLLAVEMQEMGYWFTFDHQMQIKKKRIIPACWFATNLWNQMYSFAFFPDETDLGFQVFPCCQRERERGGGVREQKRWIISTYCIICRQWRMEGCGMHLFGCG